MISTRDIKDLFAENTPERIVDKARKLAGKGKPDQAIATIKEALAQFGENPDLRIEMATLFLSLARPRDAGEALRALLKADAKHVARVEEFVNWARVQFTDLEAIHEAVAEGHITRRNLKAAMESLEQIDKKQIEQILQARLTNLNRFLMKGTAVPKSALPTLYFAALGYEVTGDWQKAVEHYKKVLAASPGDFPTVEERMKTLVGRNYKLTALRLAWCELLSGAGKPERAREEYLKTLEVDPRSAARVGQFIETSLAAAPDDADLLWASVRVRQAEGKLADALEICGRLLDRGSHLAEIEKLIESVSGEGKELAAAQVLLAKVALAQGKTSRAVSVVVNAMAQEGGTGAIDVLEAVIARQPSEPRPYQILADHHLKEGRTDRCLELFRAWLVVDPQAGPTIGIRLQAVLAADPAHAGARKMLEEVCVASDDASSAAPFLRRRLRQGPDAARDVTTRLRSLIAAHPEDMSLRLAAAEAAAVCGDDAAVWETLTEIASSGAAPEPPLLRLLVIAAGSSRELYARAQSWMESRAPKWASYPDVNFAMGEAAARAGDLKNAVGRFRAAAGACPEAAPVCQQAIRALRAVVPDAGDQSASSEAGAVLAEALLDGGDVAAAVEALRRAGQLPPAHAARLMERLTAALRQDPSSLELRTALAEICLAAGQVSRALEVARAGLTGREDAATAGLVMTYGDALVRASKLMEATRAYATASKREPGLAADLVERLERVISIDAGLEVAHLALGRVLLQAGRISEGVLELLSAWNIKPEMSATVVKELERAAQMTPGEPAVDLARAQLLAASGDHSGAAEALGCQVGRSDEMLGEIISRLEGIVGSRPDCARAHLELGRAYLQRGWSTRSCEELAAAYKLDRGLAEAIAAPLSQLQKQFIDEPEPHTTRGLLYEGEGKLLPAAEAYLKAASLGGIRGASALEGLRRVCGTLPSGHARPGAETQRVGVVPPRAHLLRARACRIQGEMKEAAEAALAALNASQDAAGDARVELDAIIAQQPGHAGARLARARVLIRMQDMEGAVKDLTEALRQTASSAPQVATLAREVTTREPGHAAAACVLAESLRAIGDVAGAGGALDAALARPERAQDVDLLLARRAIALASGQDDLARQFLDRARRAAPSADALLERLHREACAEAARVNPSDPILETIAATDYVRAAQLMEGMPSSAAKAWVLERAGRHIEAAACLQEIMGRDPEAARRLRAVYDKAVCRELSGRSPVLEAETHLVFEPQIEERAVQTEKIAAARRPR